MSLSNLRPPTQSSALGLSIEKLPVLISTRTFRNGGGSFDKTGLAIHVPVPHGITRVMNNFQRHPREGDDTIVRRCYKSHAPIRTTGFFFQGYIVIPTLVFMMRKLAPVVTLANLRAPLTLPTGAL